MLDDAQLGGHEVQGFADVVSDADAVGPAGRTRLVLLGDVVLDHGAGQVLGQGLAAGTALAGRRGVVHVVVALVLPQQLVERLVLRRELRRRLFGLSGEQLELVGAQLLRPTSGPPAKQLGQPRRQAVVVALQRRDRTEQQLQHVLGAPLLGQPGRRRAQGRQGVGGGARHERSLSRTGPLHQPGIAKESQGLLASAFYTDSST